MASKICCECFDRRKSKMKEHRLGIYQKSRASSSRPTSNWLWPALGSSLALKMSWMSVSIRPQPNACQLMPSSTLSAPQTSSSGSARMKGQWNWSKKWYTRRTLSPSRKSRRPRKSSDWKAQAPCINSEVLAKNKLHRKHLEAHLLQGTLKKPKNRRRPLKCPSRTTFPKSFKNTI